MNAHTNMFDTLEQATRLVEENRPDEAYQLIKDAVAEDSHGFARVFLSEWMKHLSHEEEKVQNKFAEIVLFLREDYPEIINEAVFQMANPQGAEPEPVVPESELVMAQHMTASPVLKEQVKPRTVRKPKVSQPQSEVEREPLTLTFYEWQMSAIEKAAHKQDTDENTLLSQILETGNVKALAWARYHQGASSPAKRITITIPGGTKETLDSAKNAEGVKTTTKYVRKLLFGHRAEKY